MGTLLAVIVHPSDMQDGGVECNTRSAYRSVLPGQRDAIPGHVRVVKEFDGRRQSPSLQVWSADLSGHSGGAGARSAASSLSLLTRVTGLRRD